MQFLSRIMGNAGAFSLVLAQLVPLPALLAPVGLGAASAQQKTRTVACYSNGNGQNSCRLPENTVSVRFAGPDRSGRCVQGRTWAQRGNALWVTGGCGGNFEVTYGSRGSGGGWGGGTGYGSGSGNQDFAGQIDCRSYNNSPQTCYANTQNRAQLLQQYSQTRCVEGKNWRADRNSITVRNGCQARFGYGYGNNSGSGGGWGGSDQGFAGQIDCRSEHNRYQRCGANTENHVRLMQQFSNTSCTEGRSWGYDRGSIWVNNGCQARFAYGYGNSNWNGGSSSSEGGSNAGGIIAGGLLAAGLIALLSQAGKGKTPSPTATSRSATIEADFSKFPSGSRPSATACINEAARQVGVTGGTKLRLTDVDGAQQTSGNWTILARLSATYDDYIQPMTMDCRATGDKVTAFEIR